MNCWRSATAEEVVVGEATGTGAARPGGKRTEVGASCGCGGRTKGGSSDEQIGEVSLAESCRLAVPFGLGPSQGQRRERSGAGRDRPERAAK